MLNLKRNGKGIGKGIEEFINSSSEFQFQFQFRKILNSNSNSFFRKILNSNSSCNSGIDLKLELNAAITLEFAPSLIVTILPTFRHYKVQKKLFDDYRIIVI